MCVHDRVQVDPADALERAHQEGVGREQLAGTATLHVALAEARAELLEERRLLRGQLDRPLGVLPFQRQPALVPRAEPSVVEDLLHRDRRDAPPLQRQGRLDPVAAVRRVRQRQLLDPRHHLRRGGHRVALGDRRQVLEAVQALQLEAPLPVVEAGAVDAAPPARLGDVAQPLGQLQHRQPAVRQLLVRVLGRDPACRLRHLRPSSPSAWTSPGRKTRRLRRQVTARRSMWNSATRIL